MPTGRARMSEAGLVTPRMSLLPWKPEDTSEFLPIASDREVMRYIGDGLPWSREQVERFVARQIDVQRRYGFCLWQLRFRATGALIGFCGLQPLDGTDEIEIGWWLARAFWGQGLATEAAREAMRDGLERVGLRRVVAIAQLPNLASVRIMKKLGMKLEREMEWKGVPVAQYAIESNRPEVAQPNET